MAQQGQSSGCGIIIVILIFALIAIGGAFLQNGFMSFDGVLPVAIIIFAILVVIFLIVILSGK